MSLSVEDREEITSIIKTTVNGKIDRMNDKLDVHIEQHNSVVDEIRVVIEAVQWLNSTRKFMIWGGGMVAALVSCFALWNNIK